MARITVIGGTGYAGAAIVREAAQRGHEVVSYSRHAPGDGDAVQGVRYVAGSVLDPAVLRKAVMDADVLVSALSPRGELDGQLVDVDRELAARADGSGVRLLVVGGFSSLRMQLGSPRMAEGDDIPPQFAGEARQMNAVLQGLLAGPESVDWTFVSPAMQFGSYVPGEALGRYRSGGEVALFDEAGASALSGADFALAVVDEIEHPTKRRAQISFAY